MPVRCLKRPCAIFDEFEPVTKIRLLDANKTEVNLRLSVGENTVSSRQTTCLVVPPIRKRHLQSDDDVNRHLAFSSSRKKAKMVIQARAPTSVDISGGNVHSVCADHSGRRQGLDPTSPGSDDMIISATSFPSMDTQWLGAQCLVPVPDEAVPFSCFNFWRSPLPGLDSLDELCGTRDEAAMEDSDGTVAFTGDSAAPDVGESGEYNEFSFWKFPMEILEFV